MKLWIALLVLLAGLGSSASQAIDVQGILVTMSAQVDDRVVSHDVYFGTNGNIFVYAPSQQGGVQIKRHRQKGTFTSGDTTYTASVVNLAGNNAIYTISLRERRGDTDIEVVYSANVAVKACDVFKFRYYDRSKGASRPKATKPLGCVARKAQPPN